MSINFHPDVNYQLQQYAPDEEQKPVTTSSHSDSSDQEAMDYSQFRRSNNVIDRTGDAWYQPLVDRFHQKLKSLEDTIERPFKPEGTQEDTPGSTTPLGATEKPAGEFNVDRGHNVPLVATALTDGSGIAIDHRVNTDFNFGGKIHDITPFIALHELTELPHMQNLMETGMSPQDAYHEAHDKIAIPIETAASRAYAVRNGYDPDEFHEAYKQHVRDQTAIAAEPSDQERHPQGHTTEYGLDETEGAIQAKHAQLLDKDPTASMAGIKSKTASMTDLADAQKMSKQGMSAEDIFKATRWFKSPEGRWKYEIPNAEATLKLPENPNLSTAKSKWYSLPNEKMTLGDILEHPTLYEAYPHLKDVPVKSVPLMQALGGVKAGHNSPSPEAPKGEFFVSGTTKPEEMTSRLLHEIQHSIQSHEGFERGGNTPEFEHEHLDQFRRELEPHGDALRAKLKTMGIETDLDSISNFVKPMAEKGNFKYLGSSQQAAWNKIQENPELAKQIDLYSEVKKNIGELENQAFKKYESLAGEVEARNVQKRWEDKIMSKPPWQTEDIPLHEQTFRKAVGTELLQGSRGGHRIPTLEELMDRPLDE